MKSRSPLRKYRIAVTVLSVLLVGTWMSTCSGPDDTHPTDQVPQMTEIWSYGYGDIKTVRIELSGIIMHEEESGLFSINPDMVESVLQQIRAAELDPEVQAIILEISSPGGGVTPSDEIYHALQRFRTSRDDRRIVAFIRDLGASGAYYAAVASDLIMAEPTAVVGSIGVIMQSINMEGLAEKIGITDVTIKSGKNKDLLNPFKSADTNQIALLQEMIDSMQERFVGLVSESRNIDPAAQPNLFDGRIFPSAEALENGLIDGIGYWDDVVTATAELLNTRDLYIVRYKTESSFMEALSSLRSPVQLPALKPIHGTHFMYLWKP